MAAAVLLALGFAVAASQIPGQAQSTPPGLKFFTNYFLTGDIASAGVGLRGKGTSVKVADGTYASLAKGTIKMTGVPPEADVVAAFLYWQVVTKDSLGANSGAMNVTFNPVDAPQPQPLGDVTTPPGTYVPYSKVLNQGGTAPCWSSGGGTGSSGGNILTYTYRADVRRFLKTDANDRIVANGDYLVQVPDSGSTGNGVPIALGASLVVVYRRPADPLRAIVLYDGGVTINNTTPSSELTIKGFYDPKIAGSASLTFVVGSGQPNKRENVFFSGVGDPVATDPFTANDGRDPSWDTVTIPVPPPTGTLGDYGVTAKAKIDTTGLSGADCLTPAMIAFRTDVNDSDDDGLLDLWETTSGLKDPRDRTLPDLKAMDASATGKDLFVEIGYMKTDAQTTYGSGATAVSKPKHTHLPTAEALKMVGQALANGPNGGIKVHFDVGNNYQQGEASPYVIPSSLARGGEAIDELAARTASCPTANDCQFPDYPGTVGWKAGYRFYRDQLVVPLPKNATTDPCDVEGYQDGPDQECERRFDPNRRQMFRYVLAAHFIGLPKSEYPCLDANGSLVPASPDRTCTGDAQPGHTKPVKPNPLFHEPRTVSGVGDFPGGDVMLTLGGFNAPNPSDPADPLPVGTSLQQAGTLLHELGHNFDLGHAGIYEYSVTRVEEPNCNPNYPSAMNYLFQLRGLFDGTEGGSRTDFSRTTFTEIDESQPDNRAWGGRYFTAWYAPQSEFTTGTPVTKHCTGTPPPEGGPAMVRVDGPTTLDGTIDWDLVANNTNASQDVNYDGKTTTLNGGSNDWTTMRLNQLATRRNVFGMSLNVGRDGMGLGDKLGRDGMGRDGMGRDGMGRDGMGRDGMGRDGMGRDGMGRDGMGRDGMGRDGMGGGDGLGRDGMGHDWMNRDIGELDAEVAAEAGHIDAAAPTIGFTLSGQLGSGGWYQGAVTVTVTATDPSRITDLRCTNYTLSNVTGIGGVSASGQLTLETSTLLSCAATDSAGNTTTTASGSLDVKIDGTVPTVTITTPADGATYLLTQVLAANYACADAGSGIVSCTGEVSSDGTNWTPVVSGAGLSTSSLGTRSFRVTATDAAGYSVTKTHTYSIGYGVTVATLKSPAQLGSAVPVIWQIKDGTGGIISDVGIVSRLESAFSGLSCGSLAEPVIETLYSLPNGSTGKSTLRFVAPNFQFNWDTTSATTTPIVTGKGCYTVRIYLKDNPSKAYSTMAVQLK